MDASEIKAAAGETGGILKAGQDAGGSSAKEPAQLNVKAASKYLGLLSRDRAQVSDGLQRALNSVHSTLNSYIQDPQRIRSAAQASSLEGEGEFSRLSSRVISRDASLSESVAEDLSSKSHLVRSRDASAEFEKTMGDLPPALKEDTAAGAALSKAIAQSLLNLTDHQTLGAGLERDLAVRGVYVPEQELSQRSRDATSRVLQVSLAFAKSNSPEELKELPAEPEPAKEAPGSTTPQIMTRYLRQALDEFPDDSTYLDIFRKNKEAGAPQPDDKVSIETAERIHNLIAKAAETARRGNLIPGGNSQGSAAAGSSAGSFATSAGNEAPRSSTAAAPDGGDARELSLSELSERASRLQRQFRLERQKLASEGQMPDPAEYPPSRTGAAGKPGTADAAVAEASKADAAKIAEPTSEKQASENTTYKAAPESKEAAGASAKAAQAAPAEATAKAGQAPSSLSLEDAQVSVSYKAVQNPFYGGISSVPGMTLPVNGFDDQAALGFAARSMVQDFSTPRTISRILKEQEALARGALSAPKGTAESSLKTAGPQAAAASSAQENAQPVLKGEAETAAGNPAKAPAAAGGNADASSVPEEAPSTVSENGASKQASAAPASTAAATADAVSDEALATEEAKPSSAVQTTKFQTQSVESISTEETAPEAEAKPSVQAVADELEPAATEDAVDHASAEDATSSELKAASTAPAASGTQAADEAAIEDDKSSKAQQEGAQAQASSSQAAAPAEDEAAGAIEEASQEAQKAAQSSKPQTAFVAASKSAEASSEAAAKAEDLEGKQATQAPRQEPSQAAAEPLYADAANAATATSKQTSVKSTDGQAVDAGAQTRTADAAANEAETTAEQDSKAANSAQSSKPQAAFTASASSAEAAAKAASEVPETVQQPAQAGTASAAAASEAEASVPASEEAPVAASTAADAEAVEDASTAVQDPAKGSASPNSTSQQILAPAASEESSAEEPATEKQPASASGKSASAASVTSGSGSAASSLPESTAVSSSVQAAAAQAENADESADTSSKSASAAGLKASEAAQSFVAAGMSATAGGASTDDASSEGADADKAGADAGAKSAPSQGSSIGDSIMKGTVPASELDDSDTPEDAPDNDGRNLGREAAGAIDTAKEASGEAEAAKAPADPLKAPAAAAVTTGGSAPVPQESVITTPQGTVKEGGFLRRLASIFSPSKAAANAAAAEAAAAQQGAALQLKLSQGSPLDVFASTLASLGASRFLPPEVRQEARDLRAMLMDPVRDLATVDSWLEFVAAPMSPSSPRAIAMHQWAFFILCLRFRELGKSVDKFLKKLGIDISADLPIDDMLLSHQDDEGAGEKLCRSTLSQLQRLQQLAPQDAEGFFNRAIPLPPAYDGGKEGSLSLRREKRKDGRKLWHLQFAFDLEKLGPVEIRAVASFPEVRLSYVAQTLEGLQALQSKVPELEKQLGDLGLEPRSSSPRIGRVDAMERRGQAARAPKAPDGMVDVDI